MNCFWESVDSFIDFFGVGVYFWRCFGDIFRVSLHKLRRNVSKKPRLLQKIFMKESATGIQHPWWVVDGIADASWKRSVMGSVYLILYPHLKMKGIFLLWRASSVFVRWAAGADFTNILFWGVFSFCRLFGTFSHFAKKNYFVNTRFFRRWLSRSNVIFSAILWVLNIWVCHHLFTEPYIMI